MKSFQQDRCKNKANAFCVPPYVTIKVEAKRARKNIRKCIVRIRTYYTLFISDIVSKNVNGFQTKHYFSLVAAAAAMAT